MARRRRKWSKQALEKWTGKTKKTAKAKKELAKKTLSEEERAAKQKIYQARSVAKALGKEPPPLPSRIAAA